MACVRERAKREGKRKKESDQSKKKKKRVGPEPVRKKKRSFANERCPVLVR